MQFSEWAASYSTMGRALEAVVSNGLAVGCYQGPDMAADEDLPKELAEELAERDPGLLYVYNPTNLSLHTRVGTASRHFPRVITGEQTTEPLLVLIKWGLLHSRGMVSFYLRRPAEVLPFWGYAGDPRGLVLASEAAIGGKIIVTVGDRQYASQEA